MQLVYNAPIRSGSLERIVGLVLAYALVPVNRDRDIASDRLAVLHVWPERPCQNGGLYSFTYSGVILSVGNDPPNFDALGYSLFGDKDSAPN